MEREESGDEKQSWHSFHHHRAVYNVSAKRRLKTKLQMPKWNRRCACNRIRTSEWKRKALICGGETTKMRMNEPCTEAEAQDVPCQLSVAGATQGRNATKANMDGEEIDFREWEKRITESILSIVYVLLYKIDSFAVEQAINDLTHPMHCKCSTHTEN